MSSNLSGLLANNKEQELLQSFIRVGLTVDDETSEEQKRKSKHGLGSPPHKNRSEAQQYRKDSRDRRLPMDERRKSVKFQGDGEERLTVARISKFEADLRMSRRKSEDLSLKKKIKENFVDFYTDKDRAAAVSAGASDIKDSLKEKKKQDRQENISMLTEETDINSIIALGLKEIKNANSENALHFFTKALELNNNDINALIARSKCYLLLGESKKALEDAEAALAEDKSNIRAIYQKAESLYYLGQFEQSLMFFHRGLRARPELTSFRLGVQKTEECIENTIGNNNNRLVKSGSMKLKIKKSDDHTPKSQQDSARSRIRVKPTKADLERRNARKLLGKLCVDKEYLENLLNHPDLVRADNSKETISLHAKEAVDFLDKRQEFWRQQRPCTALPNHKALNPGDPIPKWF